MVNGGGGTRPAQDLAANGRIVCGGSVRVHGTLARVHAATALWEDDYYPATLVSFTAAARSDVIKLGKEQYVMHFDDGKIQERLSLPDPAVRIMSQSVGRCMCKLCVQRNAQGRAVPLLWAVATPECSRDEGPEDES